MTIDTVIFDLGRVLINWYPYKYMKEKFGEDLAEKLNKAIFNATEWNLMDKGLLSEEELWNLHLKRFPDLKFYIEHLKSKVTEFLTPIEDNIKLIPKLKEKGYRLFILSNFSKNSFEAIYKKYDFFNYFDGMVISSHHKTVKPEKKIYQILIEKYNITPSTSLFIDDKIENINTARELGFSTIHLENPLELKKQLKNMMII
ncbi:HAD family phosphatase [Thermosipho ferrireducens]|uniref:HAD family phosphatase n=1 Tax=Thermosipho ferrireducens TaxID=2571116 RepID=A0ABX7S6V1_9BACT|nr:HAD family phosphatase [Thermosipho ferrireducens]QTA38299.1 HAD family phosphatase [Thermosipho ferrireducens]